MGNQDGILAVELIEPVKQFRFAHLDYDKLYATHFADINAEYKQANCIVAQENDLGYPVAASIYGVCHVELACSISAGQYLTDSANGLACDWSSRSGGMPLMQALQSGKAREIILAKWL
jgi:hypothetical protein